MTTALERRLAAFHTPILVSLTFSGGPPDNGSGAAVSNDNGSYVVFIFIAETCCLMLIAPARVRKGHVRDGPNDWCPTTYLYRWTLHWYPSEQLIF